MGVAREQQEHLLPAHRTADGVDTARIDSNSVCARDRRHPGEVSDLARISPGVEAEPAPLSVGVDDREVSEAGQLAPEARVLAAVQPAPMRGDDERDRPAVVAPR